MITKEFVSENIVSENKDKPVFDEQTLAKVLEAAYLLQEHNRELLETEPRTGRPGHLEHALRDQRHGVFQI